MTIKKIFDERIDNIELEIADCFCQYDNCGGCIIRKDIIEELKLMWKKIEKLAKYEINKNSMCLDANCSNCKSYEIKEFVGI